MNTYNTESTKMQEVEEEIFDESDSEGWEDYEGGVVKSVPAGPISFLRDRHDLEGLLKGLDRASKKAVKRLVKGLDSMDEKIAVDCAKALLKLQMDVSKEINNDQINRIIAEFKYNRLAQIKDIASKDVKDEIKPFVDFENILEV